MANQTVSELDFRQPEYRDAKVEDYEFRGDGKLVRKDRWETGIGTIRSLVGISAREFEIRDVVEAVRKLVEDNHGWTDTQDDIPDDARRVRVRLADGSMLRQCQLHEITQWTWNNQPITAEVVSWRDETFDDVA